VARHRPALRWRVRDPKPKEGGEKAEDTFLELDPGELSGIFAAPQWLRDLGIFSWLLVGVAAAVVGAIALLAATETIVIPVIVAAIISAVGSPIVAWLERHHIPRAIGALIVLLFIVLAGAAVFVMVVGGISSQSHGVSEQLSGAVDKLTGYLQDVGASPEKAAKAGQDGSSSVSDAFHALLTGLAASIDALASLAVFLAFTILSTFFLLKDGPLIRRFVGRHMGVPPEVGETIMSRTAGAMQSYFLGMTIVAAFSAVIVGAGALVLGVHLAGTITVVTFLGGYIPYLGAWTAGAFAVLMALGSNGPETALAMAVIALLANGALQQMVQPIAYGATLGIHPLAVLIVTIAGGSLFGTIGLILAAPLTSAVVKITEDLRRARANLPEAPEGDRTQASTA
jgi:predicted PurR-regulated permease PerM